MSDLDKIKQRVVDLKDYASLTEFGSQDVEILDVISSILDHLSRKEEKVSTAMKIEVDTDLEDGEWYVMSEGKLIKPSKIGTDNTR